MQRRDLSKVLFASTAGAAILARNAEAQTCNPPCFPTTAAEAAAGVVPVNQQFKEGYLQRYGGVGDGIVNSTLALVAAAAQSAQPGGVSVKISGGMYRVAANTTLAAASPMDFSEGGSLAIDAGVDLAINGRVAAPPRNIFAGSGRVFLFRDTNPDVWANWFPGADIGQQVNNAVNAVGRVGPLCIRIAPADYPYSTRINLANTESIRLTGADTPLFTPNNRKPNLAWTGSTGSGAAIACEGAYGLEIDHLSLTYTNVAYDGNLISLQMSGSVEARLCSIHHCSITGTHSAQFAARLVALAGTLSTTIEKNYFRYAVRGIACTGTSNNAIAIRDNWFEKDFSAGQILAQGGSWTIDSNVFEADPAGAVVAALTLTGELNGLSFRGNMCVDGGSGGGTLIDLAGAPCSGVEISGNVIGAASGIAIALSPVANASDAISISGNTIVSSTGINLAASKNVQIVNNKFTCTVPWTGSAPTRYFVNGNDTGTTVTSGIPIAHGSSVPVAMTSAEGAGMIFVYSAEDNAQAIFALNGTRNVVDKISDPAGMFGTSAGGAGTINVFASGGTSYRLENRRGSARTIVVNSMFGR